MPVTQIAENSGYIARVLHSPKQDKIYGFLVGKPDERGNLSDMTEHRSEVSALSRLGLVYGLHDERCGEFIVRKTSDAEYMVGRPLWNGKARLPVLTECRVFIARSLAIMHAGGIAAPAAMLTPPKSSHLANQKGYQSPGKRNGGK